MWRSIKQRGYPVASLSLAALYPSRCPVCNNHSDSLSYAPICRDCWSGIERYRGPSCRICAVPLSSDCSFVCGDCLSRKPSFSSVLNFGLYSGTLREAIHLLKFNGVKRLVKPLGGFLHELTFPALDGIVPVPLSKSALRQRGFNQTLLLARVLARRLEIPLCMNALHKRKDTPAQIGLKAKERLANLKNAFEVVEPVAGKQLLLLDDVMTTGATVRECSKTLVKAGAKEVVVVTLARSSTD